MKEWPQNIQIEGLSLFISVPFNFKWLNHEGAGLVFNLRSFATFSLVNARRFETRGGLVFRWMLMAADAAGLTFQFKTLMRAQPATATLGTAGEGRLAALEKGGSEGLWTDEWAERLARLCVCTKRLCWKWNEYRWRRGSEREGKTGLANGSEKS